MDVHEHKCYLMNSLTNDLKEALAKIEVPRGSNYHPHVNDWGLIDSRNFGMNLELKISKSYVNS